MCLTPFKKLLLNLIPPLVFSRMYKYAQEAMSMLMHVNPITIECPLIKRGAFV